MQNTVITAGQQRLKDGERDARRAAEFTPGSVEQRTAPLRFTASHRRALPGLQAAAVEPILRTQGTLVMTVTCPICQSVLKSIPAYLAHVSKNHPGTEVAGGRR